MVPMGLSMLSCGVRTLQVGVGTWGALLFVRGEDSRHLCVTIMSLESASKAPLVFCGFVLTAEGHLFKDTAESPEGKAIVTRGSGQPWSFGCRVKTAVREEGYQLVHRTSSSLPCSPVHTEPRDTLTMGTSDSEAQAIGVRHCLSF